MILQPLFQWRPCRGRGFLAHGVLKFSLSFSSSHSNKAFSTSNSKYSYILSLLFKIIPLLNTNCNMFCGAICSFIQIFLRHSSQTAENPSPSLTNLPWGTILESVDIILRQIFCQAPDVLAREWNTDKNNGLQPSQVMPYTNRKVWWLCQKGHEWKATVSDRSDGKGCPFCSGKRPIPGETDLATLMPEIAAEWNYEKNRGKTPQMFTRASGLKVWWKCPQGHSWRATILARSRNGSGCPRCAKQRYFSGGGF